MTKIKKYQKSLDVWAIGGAPKSVVHKVRWGLSMNGEIEKLKGYLNLHVATINMLLMEHGLEKMSFAQERADSDNLQIRERLDVAQSLIERLKDTVSGQMALVQNTNAMLKRLMDTVCGEFRTSWKSLGEMAANIWYVLMRLYLLCIGLQKGSKIYCSVSTQQVYGVVLEIKSTMGTVDTRFTFFQTPLVVEDALGVKFPIPSEWDYGMVENHIQYRFREGIGSQDVKAGNWELFKTKNSKDIILPNTRLLPGSHITMAIIISTPTPSEDICPIFSCRSSVTALAPGGGRFW